MAPLDPAHNSLLVLGYWMKKLKLPGKVSNMAKAHLIQAMLEVIVLKERSIDICTEPFVHAPLARLFRFCEVCEGRLDSIGGLCPQL